MSNDFHQSHTSGQKQSNEPNKRMCYWEDENRHHHTTAETNASMSKTPLCSYAHYRQFHRVKCCRQKPCSRTLCCACLCKISLLFLFLFHSLRSHLLSTYPQSLERNPSPILNEREIDRDTTVHLAFPLPPWTPPAAAEAEAALAEISSVQIICANFTILVFMNLHKFHKMWKKSLPLLNRAFFAHSLVFFVSMSSVCLHLVHILSKGLRWLGVCVGLYACACTRMQASDDVQTCEASRARFQPQTSLPLLHNVFPFTVLTHPLLCLSVTCVLHTNYTCKHRMGLCTENKWGRKYFHLEMAQIHSWHWIIHWNSIPVIFEKSFLKCTAKWVVRASLCQKNTDLTFQISSQFYIKHLRLFSSRQHFCDLSARFLLHPNTVS